MAAKGRKRRTNRRIARDRNLLDMPTIVIPQKTHESPQNSHLEAEGIAQEAPPSVAIIAADENRNMSLMSFGA